MSPTSDKTIRIRSIPQHNGDEAFVKYTQSLTSAPTRKPTIFTRPSRASAELSISTSLAPQNDENVGTISFPSRRLKEKALGDPPSGWILDDKFDGITVLHSHEKPELDICAVHGLGGHAFDTWLAETKMWLRDLLPFSNSFERSRIMTFGYNSAPRDSKSVATLNDWANDLLEQVDLVRQLSNEKDRPIIFVCHSLGGLVAREAMIRLDRFPHKFPNIRLKNCGLLFLSTPHSGTTEADWNKYLVDIGELTTGLRPEIINGLRSFNRSSADSQENFGNMENIPPFFCLCESEKTRVGPSLRYVVSKGSAGLNGHSADQIAGVDHKQICKFENKYGGYGTVVDRLGKLRDSLMSDHDGRVMIDSETALGSPPIVSPYSPLPKGVKFYEGRHIRRVSGFAGRSHELEELAELLSNTKRGASNGIALTGIGGIGKTELLLQIANQNRNFSNVFLLPACDEKSLREGYMEIASRIGHEILSARHSKQDLHSIWCSYTADEKIKATKAWFEEPENQDTLFIVDDLDGLKDEDAIQAVLPRQAKIVMLSTRNPGLVAELPRKFDRLRVSPLNVNEAVDLMGASLHNWNKENIPIPVEELEEIANEVACHPLGALNAISYITARLAQDSDSPVAEFLAILRSGDYHERLEFLKYKPPFRYSVMQTFDVSFQRLRHPDGLATILLSLLGFLELDEPEIDFRRFFFKREWLHELKEYLPDHTIFAAERSTLRAALEELENVSIGHRTEQKLPLQVHPLWIECLRQRLGHGGRVRFLQQVLLVCYGSIIRKEELINIIPHVKTCLYVAVRFQISMDDLDLAPDVRTWIDGFSAGPETPPSAIVPNTGASDFDQDSYKNALELSEDCARVAEDFISDAVDIIVSHEKWSMLAESLMSLLKRLQKHEGIYQKQLREEIYGLHMRAYDSLLIVASQIRKRHPMLHEQLQSRRATFEEKFLVSS
ncbi:hypothetical protein B0J14DRAFT_660433 [Halenospora varia]|nr:hypothetical protein B0J14DRAFT_660433 [Halenospora varia]